MRLAFDTEIRLPNYTEKSFIKMSIDKSYKAFKRNDFKVSSKINVDGENGYFDRPSIFKIL